MTTVIGEGDLYYFKEGAWRCYCDVGEGYGRNDY
jgi:hypothetical protein